jgi:hypothetical protein
MGSTHRDNGKRCWVEKRLKVGFPTLAGDAVGLTNRLHLAVQARLFGFPAFQNQMFSIHQKSNFQALQGKHLEAQILGDFGTTG